MFYVKNNIRRKSQRNSNSSLCIHKAIHAEPLDNLDVSLYFVSCWQKQGYEFMREGVAREGERGREEGGREWSRREGGREGGRRREGGR